MLWTSDGYRMRTFNREGASLQLGQSWEMQDGLSVNIGVSFSMFTADGKLSWSEVRGGDGTDKLEQALPTLDGWIAAGSSSSSRLGEGWHPAWYDHDEPKTDGWVIRIDDAGDVLWSRNYGGSDWDSFMGICEAKDGGWILAGNTYSSDGDVTAWHDSGELFRQPDAWILHIDESGRILWQKALGGSGYDAFSGVRQIPSGYMAVGVTASADGDVTSPLGDWDGWVVLLDKDGNIIREITYGASSEDMLVSLQQGPDGWLAIGTTWLPSRDGETMQNAAWAMLLNQNGDVIWEKTFGNEHLQKVHRAVWMDSFWAIAGTSYYPDGENPWIYGIDRGGENGAVLRGTL